MVALATATTCAGVAHADGFDASIFRPSADRLGIGTIDGPQAPESSALDLSLASDLALDSVVLDRSNVRQAILPTRLVLEPGIALGLESSFGMYARAPLVAHDQGMTEGGSSLSSAGVLPPVLGAIIPVFRQPLNDARLALRGEAAAPVGDPSQFRGDGAITGLIDLVYGGGLGRAYFLASAGASLAPRRGVGDASLGNAARIGVGARYPQDGPLRATASVDLRVDPTTESSSSAMATLGLEWHMATSTLRFLAGAGIRPAIGTPSAMFGVTWTFGTGPTISSPPEDTHADKAIAAAREPQPAPALPSLPVVPRGAPAFAAIPGERTTDTIVIPPVLFATSSSALDADALRGLSGLAPRLVAAQLSVRIVGHADERGDAPSNLTLGSERASAVRDFLVTLGIPASRIETTSAGASSPARGRERNADDQQRDRRVEIFVVPPSGVRENVTDVSL